MNKAKEKVMITIVMTLKLRSTYTSDDNTAQDDLLTFKPLQVSNFCSDNIS